MITGSRYILLVCTVCVQYSVYCSVVVDCRSQKACHCPSFGSDGRAWVWCTLHGQRDVLEEQSGTSLIKNVSDTLLDQQDNVAGSARSCGGAICATASHRPRDCALTLRAVLTCLMTQCPSARRSTFFVMRRACGIMSLASSLSWCTSKVPSTWRIFSPSRRVSRFSVI